MPSLPMKAMCIIHTRQLCYALLQQGGSVEAGQGMVDWLAKDSTPGHVRWERSSGERTHVAKGREVLGYIESRPQM